MTPEERKEKVKKIVLEQLKYTCPHSPAREVKECSLCKPRIDVVVNQLLSLFPQPLSEEEVIMFIAKLDACDTLGEKLEKFKAISTHFYKPAQDNLKIICDICHKELKEFGANLYGTPDENMMCKKIHLCKSCYRMIKTKPALTCEWIEDLIRKETLDIGIIKRLAEAIYKEMEEK